MPIRNPDGASIWIATEQDPAPSVREFAQARALLEESYSRIGEATWQVIEGMILDKEWPKSRLVSAVHHVLEMKSSWVAAGNSKPTIVAGDLLRLPDVKLYPRRWREEKLAEDPYNAGHIRRFVRSDGSSGYGWVDEVRPHIGTLVELYQPEKKPTRRALPEAPEVAKETRKLIDSAKAEARILALESDLERTQEKLRRAQERIARFGADTRAFDPAAIYQEQGLATEAMGGGVMHYTHLRTEKKGVVSRREFECVRHRDVWVCGYYRSVRGLNLRDDVDIEYTYLPHTVSHQQAVEILRLNNVLPPMAVASTPIECDEEETT